MLGFRVWDKDNSRFINSLDQIQMDSKGNLFYILTHALSVYPKALDPDRFIPMQSTGIFDPKGNKIFEGDILQYDYLQGTCRAEKKILVVTDFHYFIRSYYGTLSRMKNNSPDILISKYVENLMLPCVIIGNIYENPELQNKKEK